MPSGVQAWWLWRWLRGWSASRSHRVWDGYCPRFLSAGAAARNVDGRLVFHGLSRRSVQPAAPLPPGGGLLSWPGLALGAALVAYVWAGLGLAAGGVLVPQGTDEALIHLELAGFATCLVLSVGSRVFGRFLLLRTLSKLETWVPRLALGWGVGLAVVAGGWLLDGHGAPGLARSVRRSSSQYCAPGCG